MTAPYGAAIVRELERRFVLSTERVPLGDGAVTVLRPRSAEDLISEADFERDERLPYWAELWPSGQMLAGAIAREQGAGRSLLELGCGVGLVTIAAMRAGYATLATDYYEDALLFARANAWRALGAEPRTRHLDWRAPPEDLGAYDRVVASDVLYERPYAELVAGIVARTLAPSGMATIADPGRIAADAFLERCEGAGLALLRTDAERYESCDIRQTIRLHHLVRRDAPRA